MTFHVFSTKGQTFLTDETGEGFAVPNEAAGIDAAVRTAQDANAPAYTILYWNPNA